MILLELICLGYSAFLIARRYRPASGSVVIVPADALIWTLTSFFVIPLSFGALGIEAPGITYPLLPVADANDAARGIAAVTVLVAVLFAVYAAQRSELTVPAQDVNALPRSPHWKFWCALSFLPVAVVLASPNPTDYLTLGAPFVLRGVGEPFRDRESAAAQFSVLVSWSSFVSLLATAMWLRSVKRSAFVWSMVGVIGLIDYWVVGKRHIFAMFVLLILLSLSLGRRFSNRSVRRAGVGLAVALLAILSFSSWYQSQYRPFLQAERATETALVDFTRLSVLRLAIAGQLGDVPQPLDYPGQSIALYPQAIGLLGGDGDTITYTDRVTSVATDRPLQSLPGSITTSLISEAIDNFGLLGILVGSSILALAAYQSFVHRDILLALTGSIVVSMLAVVHLLALLPLVMIAVARWGTLVVGSLQAGTSRGAGAPPGRQAHSAADRVAAPVRDMPSRVEDGFEFDLSAPVRRGE